VAGTEQESDTMSSTDIDTIRSAYDSFARADIDGVLAVFAEDIQWTVPPVGDWGGTIKGKDEVLGFFMALGGRYGPFAVVPDEMIQPDDRVIVLGHHEIGEDTVPFAHVWTVRDGKASAFIEYVDNSALLPHVLS
jgi:ketosteroid isomerase-like protein